MTDQLSDFIKFEGGEYLLDDYPLESYFENSIRTRPDFLSIDLEESGSLFISSACSRRYIALWEVRAGVLYLMDVISPKLTNTFKNRIFKQGGADSYLKADWFSGKLTLTCYRDDKLNQQKIFPPEIHTISSKIKEIDFGEYLYMITRNADSFTDKELTFKDGVLTKERTVDCQARGVVDVEDLGF